jgi:hypothetical protein
MQNTEQALQSSLSLVEFAKLYGGIELSPGQLRFGQWITQYPTGPKDPILRQAIAKVSRGGGKTISAGTAFAYLHSIDRTWKIFCHSGSFEQARYLYGYYEPYIRDPDLFPPDCFKGEPTRSLTAFKEGGFLKVLAASEKQSRGGHVDICALDEVVLIKQDLIEAVLGTIRASRRPMLLIMSTASAKISYHWFIDKWQNAKELGFEPFEWPPEECPWISGTVTAQLRKLYDKATATVELEGGIADFQGFVFTGGDVDAAIVDPTNEELWPLPSAAPLTDWSLGVDWGFGHPHVNIDVEYRSDVAFIRDIQIREQEPNVVDEINADFHDRPLYSGVDGKRENAQLKAYGMNVTEVAFSTDKQLLIGEARRRFERRLIRIPDPKILAESDPPKAKEYQFLIDELRAYHYNPTTSKPVKADDDAVDALLYAMKHVVTPRPYGPGSRPVVRVLD